MATCRFYLLLLLQIFFNQLCLSQQIGDELFVRLHKSPQGSHIVKKLLTESQLLLISPGLSQLIQLRCDSSRFFVQFFVDSTQHLRESSEFCGIDNGLSHSGHSAERNKKGRL